MEFHDLDVGADEELLPAQGGAKDTEERRRGVLVNESCSTALIQWFDD